MFRLYLRTMLDDPKAPGTHRNQEPTGTHRPERKAKVYLIEDNHEVHMYENDELIETRIYYKNSRSWGETNAYDTADKWCLGLIH